MPCGCKGCWTTGEVNVGYFPCRVTQAVLLRVGPSWLANAKRDDGGEQIRLEVGDWIGVQSTRNPQGVDLPPRREPRNGFVWCYSARLHHSGWVPVALVEDNPHRGWARGPAGEDFEVGTDPCHHGAPGGCDGRRARLRRHRTVHAREVYVRYAPRSVAFGYLVAGDVVRERWVMRSGGFRCVEVLHSRTMPPGTIGWVHEVALGAA